MYTVSCHDDIVICSRLTVRLIRVNNVIIGYIIAVCVQRVAHRDTE